MSVSSGSTSEWQNENEKGRQLRKQKTNWIFSSKESDSFTENEGRLLRKGGKANALGEQANQWLCREEQKLMKMKMTLERTIVGPNLVESKEHHSRTRSKWTNSVQKDKRKMLDVSGMTCQLKWKVTKKLK